MPAAGQPWTPEDVFGAIRQGIDLVVEGVGGVVNAVRGPQGQVIVETENGDLYELDGAVNVRTSTEWLDGVPNVVTFLVGVVVAVAVLRRVG